MDGAASFFGSFCLNIPSICDSALLRVLLVIVSLLCADVEVPPFTNIKDNLPTLGTEEVLFATCTAAGSKPPAEVRWLTDALGDKVRTTANSTQYDNDTTTTVSSLFGVPTREINGHQVQCVISGGSLSTDRSLPFTIQIYFSPTEVNIRVISEDSFECVTEAKPNANFIWSRSGQSLLESAVKVDGAKLQLLSLTSDLNGLYQCEASNTYGSKRGQLYVHVASGSCSAAWALLGVLIFLSIVGAAVWYFYKHEDQSAIAVVLEGFLINVPKIPGIGLHFFGGVSQQMNQLVTVQRSKNNVRQRSCPQIWTSAPTSESRQIIHHVHMLTAK
ncbi:nectin-4-like isoform X3 [Simochromis diagramma]|uniref:nectin-4-like isoform X3 n=1 Tax=Simochromis diagramma TaxID=43689 RepID=UPI001A7E4068|nr:nectin-4-like isoform X3 [Simochromis diagramma]